MAFGDNVRLKSVGGNKPVLTSSVVLQVGRTAVVGMGMGTIGVGRTRVVRMRW